MHGGMPERQQGDDEAAGRAGREGSAASVIGVLGAGTMGAGIAQLACRAGARTLLFDPIPAALEAGMQKVAEGLQREVSRGRLSPEEAARAGRSITAVADLQALAPCELVIEAVPERLELKHEL